MMERRKLEIALLEKEYGEVEVGPNLDYVLFKHFRLPPGWNRDETEVLILIPSGYPVTKPDNFYVATGLRLKSEQMPGSYTEGQQHVGKVWGVFSVHLEDDWQPNASDLLMGHNLLSYTIAVVMKRLSEAN
jgi:hypothetical protein